MWSGKVLADELVKTHELLGATITDIGFDEEGVVCLTVTKGEWEQDKLLWILMDPEGNGPGWVDVQDVT